MSEGLNDNETVEQIMMREPDAHGQAAFLLVESLIHALVARSAITLEAAIEVVEIAAEVKAHVAADLRDSPATLDRSLAMLDRSLAMLDGLADSLRADRKV